MGELGLVTRYSSPAKTLEKATALQEKAGGELRTLLQRVDAKATPDVLPDAAGLFQRVRTELLEPLEANALQPHQQEAAGRLRSLVDGLEQKLASEARTPAAPATEALAGLASEGPGCLGADVQRALEPVEGLDGALTGAPASGVGRVGFEQLHDLRSQLTDALTDLRGAAEPAAQALRSGLQSLRTSVSDELGAAMERAGFSSKAWQQTERQYQVASLAAEFAEKGLERAKVASPFAPSKLLGTLQDLATKDQAEQLAPEIVSTGTPSLRTALEGPEGLSSLGRAMMSGAGRAEEVGALSAEERQALEKEFGPEVLDVLSWGKHGSDLGPVQKAPGLKSSPLEEKPITWLSRLTDPERFKRFKLMTAAADRGPNRELLAQHPVQETYLLDEILKEKFHGLTGEPTTIHSGGQYVRDLETIQRAHDLGNRALDALADLRQATTPEARQRANAARLAAIEELKKLKITRNRINLSLSRDAMPYGHPWEPGIGTRLEDMGRKDHFAQTFASAAETEEEMEGRRLSHEVGHHLHDIAHLASVVRRVEGHHGPLFFSRLENAHDAHWRRLLDVASGKQVANASAESIPRPLTQYAAGDPKEYFAESYAAYVFAPELLKSYDRFGYNLVEDALKLAGVHP